MLATDYHTEPYFTGPSDFTNDIQGVRRKWAAASANAANAEGTLITVKGCGVGELRYLATPSAAMGRRLLAVPATKASERFVYYFLLTKRSRFEDLESGKLNPGLSRDDILDMPGCFPYEAEQQRIADCLCSLDARLAAEGEKLAALNAYNKGLMQQLFPSATE